ncbi:unnamed protein product, partial [Chrysoparadoxa australica]
MEELAALGVRSIVLTSGTLSPLSSFAMELRIPFPVQLENPHVVDKGQAWVGVCPKGVTNVPFRSTYEHRNDPKYQLELGHTIGQLCRLIPEGVLVFFPTYSLMNACIDAWKRTSVWAALQDIKGTFVEPRYEN